MQKVIVICGPTAVGKTKLSIELAKALNTDVINGDAYQVYQNLNIGVAKPTIKERCGITHHLMDLIPSTNEFDVCTYQHLVRAKIDELVNLNKIPLIVGGSGLYIDSVITNYTFDNPSRDDDFALQYASYSNEELYLYLQQVKKDLPTSLHMNNRKRVLRYLELALKGSEEKKLNDQMVYDALVILLNDDRSKLYETIDNRVDEMIKRGLIDEVKMLYEQHLLSRTCEKAIGYKELINAFNGNCSIDEAINEIKKASRNYAKRQLTWFRHKNYVHEVFINRDDFNETIEHVKNLTFDFLNH